MYDNLHTLMDQLYPYRMTPARLTYLRNYPHTIRYIMEHHTSELRTSSVEKIPTRSIPMKDDGNCLYRCIAWKIFNDPEQHQRIRNAIGVFAKTNPMIADETLDYWIRISDEEHKSIDNYIKWVTRPKTFGGFFEMLLISNIFDILIIVVQDGKEKYRTLKGSSRLYIGYINDDHYFVLN